ncbi:MAG: hypothetical protein ACYTGQ_08855, partial [Planctomycetota bacterium]
MTDRVGLVLWVCLLLGAPGAWAQNRDQRSEPERGATRAARQAEALEQLKREMKVVAEQFEARSVRFTGGIYQNHEFKYQLLHPARVVSGKTYPVIVFLHGAGERGSDNLIQLKHLPQWMTQDGRR